MLPQGRLPPSCWPFLTSLHELWVQFPVCYMFWKLSNIMIVVLTIRCAPGYYGNPMTIGNSCKRCDCNGNSDPNLIVNECHNVTGQCQHCWGNTAGAKCERCAPGFYGDAIVAKNCQGRVQLPTNKAIKAGTLLGLLTVHGCSAEHDCHIPVTSPLSPVISFHTTFTYTVHIIH